MESDRVEGMEEEVVAMEEAEYNKGMANTILPDGYDYHFKEIKVISDMDEHGEVMMDITTRVNVKTTKDLGIFLEEFYESSGSNFNIKSGRPDRKGKNTELFGYRKCIMQVKQKKPDNPKRKGLHQDCPAELSFRLDIPKVKLNAQWISPVDI